MWKIITRKNNFYYVADADNKDELLSEFKIEVGNQIFRRIPYRIWTDLCNADSWEIFIEDRGTCEAGSVEVYGYSCSNLIYAGDTEDESFGEFIASFYQWMPYEELPQQTYKINLPKKDKKKSKKEKKKVLL